MVLSELAAYAWEKYRIDEQRKWDDFPGFSVLCHPGTGKWLALLMRWWDGDLGEWIERCDLKCGAACSAEFKKPWLSAPLRMHGAKWIGAAFDDRTEADVIFTLFDRAVSAEEPCGYTVVLASSLPSPGAYRETALPFADSAYRPAGEAIPERLREMRRMYDYGGNSPQRRAQNFFRQGKFMEDYEDDAPWTGDFVCYFPTYHDLTTKQLRGYFSWRTRARKGDFRPICASAAYLYIYELLNGIGAASARESLEKLKAFETGYLDAGMGDGRMRQNLRRWMTELAVISNVPPQTAREYADPELIGADGALAALKSPETRSDEEVFTALCFFGGKKIAASPVFTADAGKGVHLFADAWRRAAADYRADGKKLAALCFGRRVARRWFPLNNAVYYRQSRPADFSYALTECRSYTLSAGVWQEHAYDKVFFDRDRLRGFLRTADLHLRRYLKTGRALKEKPEDAWASPFIDAAIEEDRRAAIAAARPKITIDLTGLDKIRADALATRDSLLTEEERLEAREPAPEPRDEPAPPGQELPLNDVQIRILRALLRGESPDGIVKADRLMPSVAADLINEALFDLIGDVAVLCENDRLSLVEDYTDDVARILGGTDL
ncbi:MAG: TerB N-terminal domain-containing protein [Clostridia bacterium]|nr:TerB N-terminal domain-containing protein [Clostridia bacterium]